MVASSTDNHVPRTKSSGGARRPAADIDDLKWRQALATEAQQIQKWAELWSVAYREDAVRWRGVSTGISLLGALLAAVSGGAGLGLPPGVGRMTAGVIALAAAAVTAIGSALAAGTRTGEMHAAAKSNINLADRARTFATVGAPFAHADSVAADFDALCKLRDKVAVSSPICANRTYRADAKWERPAGAGFATMPWKPRPPAWPWLPFRQGRTETTTS